VFNSTIVVVSAFNGQTKRDILPQPGIAKVGASPVARERFCFIARCVPLGLSTRARLTRAPQTIRSSPPLLLRLCVLPLFAWAP
jgi:hypothetical protein